MRTLLLLLVPVLLLASFLPAAPAAASTSLPAVICVSATDNYGYTWTLSINTQTHTITGTWDTTSIGCPVYDVTGSYTGAGFTMIATQNVTTGCDPYVTFTGTVNVATHSASGTYQGSITGTFPWSWTGSRC